MTSEPYRAASSASPLALVVSDLHVGTLRQDLMTSVHTALDDYDVGKLKSDVIDMGCALNRVAKLIEIVQALGVADTGRPVVLRVDRDLITDYIGRMLSGYREWVGELLDDSAEQRTVPAEQIDEALAGLAAAEALSHQLPAALEQAHAA